MSSESTKNRVLIQIRKTWERAASRYHKINIVSHDCNVLFYYCEIILLSTLFAPSLYTANVKPIRGKCTQRIPYYSTIRAPMLAVEQTHRFAMHELKINTVGTCNDAPFRPRVSIHLLSVACLPSCMITRAVVKCCWPDNELSVCPLLPVSRSHKIMLATWYCR